MAVIFKEDGHIYESLNKNLEKENIKWLSVTSFVSMFKPKFNSKAQARKSAKNKKSKWYGMEEKDILAAWNGESERAINLGNWYHNQRETDILDFKTIERQGIEVPIIKPIIEHLVYLKSAGICGQADIVEIVKGKINITDYKTNKEIKEKGYTNWEGNTKKMYNPLGHLDDCNLNHYNIQLSLYAYIIKKHNPKLKVGDLTIQHVKFVQADTDKNGYPISKLVNGEPVIENIKIYKLPYLKDEIRSIIMWLKDNYVSKNI